MIEVPGFTPKREIIPQADGTVIVYVTPPPLMGCPRVSVRLTADQYERYVQWRYGEGMIQDLLVDLSADDREKLMSGLTDADLRRIGGDDE
jgi:hypothetical protein